MPTLLRITLIAVSLALGIAVALGLALREPARPVARQARAAAPAAAEAPPVAPAATPAPVSAPYRDPVAARINELHESMLEIEQSSQRRQASVMRAVSLLQDQLAEAQQAPPPAAPAAAPPLAAAPAAAIPPADPLAGGDRIEDEGDGKLSINAQNSDIRVVLEQLSQQAGLNIMAGRGVTGSVTANLSGVSVETALAAILKTTGFVARREGNIIYVGTPAELLQMDQSQDEIRTRVYRPNYVKAADLQQLFTSLLTPVIGKITVSSPSEIDIPQDQNKTGGNGFAGTDVVIVRDYASVIVQIDQIFEEVDVKPRQVAIEAMILSVSLSDTYKFGVNFEALRDNANARLISGSPPANLANISVADGGLKFGFMDASLTLFIEALETIGDTNVIASPRLTCLDKQRAEIQIGEELGYVSTTVTESAATQTVNFLDVGTLLRIRPFIGNDGLIRLEVHPELSTGSVEVQQGLSLPQKQVTQVTTNVLCPDGCTVVIGGLIREDLTTVTNQIPLLGSLPWLGPVFRQKTETIDRNEIIVLITPRIVSEPFMCQEGQKLGHEFAQRQDVYFDKMSPLGRRNIGQHHLRMARAAFSAGDMLTAMKQVNLAIHYDPQSREAVALRDQIVAAGGFENESIHEYLHRGLAPLTGRHIDYSRRGFPWKDPPEFGGPLEVTASDDYGQVGPTRDILTPPPPAGALRLPQELLPAQPLPPPRLSPPPGGPER
ncbi:MAG TPA: secretin and TonB N-terminal domain-containing protein [Pirellulaceae bacterium]|nr:secretin and TonB N-terminal domain-containing protein [Pirellulaceae bacterium]